MQGRLYTSQVCQYHSQVIGWKDSSLKWPVMCQSAWDDYYYFKPS